MYPDFEFQPWLFQKAPHQYWHDINNQRKYFDWLSKELNIQDHNDWYRYKVSDIIKKGGSGILNLYGKSLFNTLKTLYPEATFDSKKFRVPQFPKGFWVDTENQKRFLNGIAKELSIEKYEDWYRVKSSEISKRGGESLLTRYGDSMIKLLQAVFPDHDWKIWKFDSVSKGFWKSDSNARDFLENFSKENDIQHLDDWHTVSWKNLQSQKGGRLLKSSGGLVSLLRKFYPEHSWDGDQRRTTPSKTQLLLFKYVKSLFPDTSVFLDFPHPEIRYEKSQRPMELDVFVPILSLAFEYHGPQHYFFHHYYGSSDDQMLRDVHKRLACEKAGITLIEIPFWWDQKISSLQATVHKFRPDLVQGNSGIPIPIEMPKSAQRYASSCTTKLISCFIDLSH